MVVLIYDRAHPALQGGAGGVTLWSRLCQIETIIAAQIGVECETIGMGRIMAETTRYSDKRLKDAFYAYVLLSEPVTFNTREVIAAVRAGYPGLSWTDKLDMDTTGTTGSIVIAPYFCGTADGAEPRMITLTSEPGRCVVSGWDDVLRKSYPVFPKGHEAVARHQTFLRITVESHDTTLAARFDAARRMTCFAAHFAALPACTGVYLPGADLVIPPGDCVGAAAMAVKGETPILHWITLVPTPLPDAANPLEWSVQSVGLAAFTGYEVFMPKVRMLPGEAAKWVYAAITMIMDRGHVFTDSDTMGMEGGDLRIRIRWMAEGKLGAQTDMWALFHPTHSSVDDVAIFGPHSRAPAPPGIDASNRGNPNSLRQKLYSLVAGGRR